ncbi:WD40-repeat-containing domain protein [Scheffersomyces coipomensis]|uniref:WD40-repeat-containing domain protein n=1 Tax=Scheffersomyces coipomensis TaxID=1788519 RepID=UPI00315DA5EF
MFNEDTHFNDIPLEIQKEEEPSKNLRRIILMIVSDTSDREVAPEAGIVGLLGKCGEFNSDALNKNEISVMEFSRDGKYLANAGENATIVIWKILHGYTKGILTLDWSKNDFLPSGSMDRTATLWHVENHTCLQTFQDEDFATTAEFRPTDDRFFSSGSNHVRLWSILETKVAYSKNLGDDNLITEPQFTPDGRYIIIGGFNGSSFVLDTKGLYHVNRFEIKDRSMVSPFHNKNGNKNAVIAASMSDDQHYIISDSDDHR